MAGSFPPVTISPGMESERTFRLSGSRLIQVLCRPDAAFRHLSRNRNGYNPPSASATVPKRERPRYVAGSVELRVSLVKRYARRGRGVMVRKITFFTSIHFLSPGTETPDREVDRVTG